MLAPLVQAEAGLSARLRVELDKQLDLFERGL
jgi:4-hydroxy-tetrahydrodipicolinate synthase